MRGPKRKTDPALVFDDGPAAIVEHDGQRYLVRQRAGDFAALVAFRWYSGDWMQVMPGHDTEVPQAVLETAAAKLAALHGPAKRRPAWLREREQAADTTPLLWGDDGGTANGTVLADDGATTPSFAYRYGDDR